MVAVRSCVVLSGTELREDGTSLEGGTSLSFSLLLACLACCCLFHSSSMPLGFVRPRSILVLMRGMPFEAYANTASSKTKITFVLTIYIIISLLFSSGPSSSSAGSIRMASSGPAFTLLVALKFKSGEYMEQFLSDIKPLCDYIISKEPTTLAYKVLKSDKDPLMVTIMERYADKEEAYLKIHRNAKPFLEFRPKLKAMQDDGNVEISGESYLDSLVGFGDRVGLESSAGSTMATSGPAFTLLVTMKFKSGEHVKQFFSYVKPLCDYIKSKEPTTLAYEVLKSDKDPLMVTFVGRYADKEEAYLNIHRSTQPFLEFRPKLKALQDEGNVEISG